MLFLERTVMETIEKLCEQAGKVKRVRVRRSVRVRVRVEVRLIIPLCLSQGPDECGMRVPHTCQDLLAEMDRFA